MADAGLLEKTTDASDSRVSDVSATVAGERALDGWPAPLQEALLPFFADLDETTGKPFAERPI